MASIFSRFADIINSNLNSMLDKAQNPNKMLKLMINEMEDTLIEIKSSCAQVMAEETKNKREIDNLTEQETLWQKRAELAVSKKLDDLAREALIEKKEISEVLREIQNENQELNLLIEKYKDEIGQLDNKISTAREKEQLLMLREKKAKESIKASKQIKKYNFAETQIRLEQLDNRIDKIEAEANIEFLGRLTKLNAEESKNSLENEFKKLDNEIEAELELLKKDIHSEN